MSSTVITSFSLRWLTSFETPSVVGIGRRRTAWRTADRRPGGRPAPLRGGPPMPTPPLAPPVPAAMLAGAPYQPEEL